MQLRWELDLDLFVLLELAGIGVPQLTTLVLDVYSVCSKYNIPLIADGGIRYSGDVVKILWQKTLC